ncbi:MAG: hypothetical protein PHW60_08255 [Kiritimatiellae bacterium]|nr:hypothetical protein [Kiritimatiellia bacterium]
MNHSRQLSVTLKVLAGVVAGAGAGLAAAIFPWQLLLVILPLAVFVLWGLIDSRMAVCVVLSTAFFVQAECVARTNHLAVTIGLFPDALTVQLPYIYFSVTALYVFWYGLGALAARRLRWSGNSYLPPLLGLLAYSLVTLCWTRNGNWSFVWQVYFTAHLLSFCLVYGLLDRYTKIRQVMRWMVVVGTVNAVITVIFLFLEPVSLKFELADHATLSLLTGGGGLNAVVRHSTGTFGRRTLLVDFHLSPTIANILLAICVGLLVSRRQNRVSYGVLACMALLFLYQSTTGDARAPFVGLVMMVGYLLLTVPQLRNRMVLYGSVVVICTAVFVGTDIHLRRLISNEPEYSRVLSLIPVVGGELAGGRGEWTVDASGSVQSAARSGLFAQGFKHFLVSDALGGGTENARLPAPQGEGLYVHNLWLSLLQDFGLPGMACVIWFGLVFFKSYLGLVRAPDSERRILGLAATGGVVAILVTSLADFVYDDPFLWPTLGLIAAAMDRARTEESPANPAE